MSSGYHFDHFKRIVIKIGANLLFEGDAIREGWLSCFAADIAELRAQNVEIIIVSSGAINLGLKHLPHKKGKSSPSDYKLEEKQAAAAIGQVLLTNLYQHAFEEHKLQTAQILLTLDDTDVRRRHLNSRATINALIKNGIIPIINENDTVSTTEIRAGDNDRLAGRVAQMVSADHLLFLSTKIHGLYKSDPELKSTAEIIKVYDIDTSSYADFEVEFKTLFKSPQISTKIDAIRTAAFGGCSSLVTNGLEDHIMKKIAENKLKKYSYFKADLTPEQARKRWIHAHMISAGSLSVTQKGEANLKEGKSLYPKDVTSINGIFQRGDLISVISSNGHVMAKGLSAYSWKDAAKIRGTSNDKVIDQLGFAGRAEIINVDDLVLLERAS